MSLGEQHSTIEIKNKIDSIWNEAIQTHGHVNICPHRGCQVTDKLCIQSNMLTKRKGYNYPTLQIKWKKKHTVTVAVILKQKSVMKKFRATLFTEMSQVLGRKCYNGGIRNVWMLPWDMFRFLKIGTYPGLEIGNGGRNEKFTNPGLRTGKYYYRLFEERFYQRIFDLTST